MSLPPIQVVPHGDPDPAVPQCPLCGWDLTRRKRPRTASEWLIRLGAATLVASLWGIWTAIERQDPLGVAAALAIVTALVWMLAERPVYECDRCHYICDRQAKGD